MSMICQNDAKIESYDFEYRAKKRDTYNAVRGRKMLTFDPKRLSEYPAIDWYQALLLKTPQSMILVSHFFTTFSSFVLSILVASNLCNRALSFLMYRGMH